MVDNTEAECIKLLEEWSDFCEMQSILHDMSRARFRSWNYALAIPAIILSTIGGAANIGISNNCSEHAHQTKTIIFGSFALGSAAIFTIHRYLNLPELQQAHDFYSDEYAKLMNEIRMQLKIDNTEHKAYTNIVEFCKACKRDLDILIDKAPAIPFDIRNKCIAEKPTVNKKACLVSMHQSMMLVKPITVEV